MFEMFVAGTSLHLLAIGALVSTAPRMVVEHNDDDGSDSLNSTVPVTNALDNGAAGNNCVNGPSSTALLTLTMRDLMFGAEEKGRERQPRGTDDDVDKCG